ncbi:hypothetical protein IAD21_03235 [Abditibacteriota bacterium]|nr:hypothetical protein IAD21_03235 [Abditibacteriota bacterium]
MALSKKFSPMRYTAASEDAAVQGALLLVGATRDDIDYDVLDQNEKGVTVRIRPREEGSASAAPAPVPEVAPVESAPVITAPPVEEVAVAAVLEDEAAPADALAESDSSEELQTSEPAAATTSEPVAAAPVEARPRKSDRNGYNRQLSAKARAQAQEFLNRMGLEAEARFGRGFNESTIPLFVDGDDVGILIGKHGATLQSFQYLLNLTVNNVDQLGGDPEGGVRITVDAGKYRQRRTTSLEAAARQAANKARREGRPIRLEPMPAHERRIVHLYLQTVPEVASASEGKDPARRVVITPSNTTPNPNFRPIMPARQGGGNRSGGSGGGMGSFNRGRRPDNRSGGSGGGGYNRGR